MRGFTIIELLVVMAIIGVLSAMATVNFFNYADGARDSAAEMDYRNLKVALYDLVNSDGAPTRIAIRRAIGPMNLPQPLTNATVSPEVSVDITYVKRFRRNRPPRTTTNIDVYHRDGTTLYRYRERDGIVTEQEIQLQ
jgi:prepilin-type N-terminal cleavage/methylation domain-containing protein